MQLMYDIIINVMRMTSAKLCEKYRFFSIIEDKE